MSGIAFNVKLGLTTGTTAIPVIDASGNIAAATLSASGATTLSSVSATSLSVSGTTTFSLNPSGITQSVNDSSLNLATTAFVLGQAASATPLMNSNAAIGTSYLYARQDHVHASDTSLLPISSPTVLNKLTITGTTVTVNTPVIYSTQTWNNSSIAFTGLLSNITNTASSATSKLLDLQVGGVSQFNVSVGGGVTATSFTGSLTGNASTATNVAYSGLTGTVPTWNQNTTGTASNITGTLAVVQGGSGTTTTTGTGSNVLSTSPILTTPNIGTPSAGTLTNCTFPTLNQNTTGSAASLSATLSTVYGGTGVSNNILATVTSVGNFSFIRTLTANTNVTFPVSGTLAIVSGALGTPASGTLTNCTGYTWGNISGTTPTWNQNTTGNAATATSATTITGILRTATTATASQTLFTCNTYTIGSNQLRVYVNGVRQFLCTGITDYTETSTTSFTLALGATVGDVVVAEIN